MKHLFISIFSIVIANIGLGFLAKNYHAFSAMTFWFAFASLISILWAKQELLRKETYQEITKEGFASFWFITLSVIGPIMYFLAIRDAGLGITSVINNAKFGVLILSSFFLFKEKPKRNNILACFILIPGFILLTETKGVEYNFGVLLAIFSMISYAGQNIINKMLAFKVPYKAMIAIRCFTINIAVILYATAIGENISMPTDIAFWATVIIGAPCGILFSKYSDFKALEQIPFFTFSIWQPLKPILIIAFSIFVFEEDFSNRKITGCILLILASLISTFKNKSEEAK